MLVHWRRFCARANGLAIIGGGYAKSVASVRAPRLYAWASMPRYRLARRNGPAVAPRMSAGDVVCVTKAIRGSAILGVWTLNRIILATFRGQPNYGLVRGRQGAAAAQTALDCMCACCVAISGATRLRAIYSAF